MIFLPAPPFVYFSSPVKFVNPKLSLFKIVIKSHASLFVILIFHKITQNFIYFLIELLLLIFSLID